MSCFHILYSVILQYSVLLCSLFVRVVICLLLLRYVFVQDLANVHAGGLTVEGITTAIAKP